MDKKKLLTLNKIEKKYNDKIILYNINLEIYEGDFIGITGESGSGKSTLLNILGGLDFPTKGDIYFKDINIQNLKEKEISKYRNENIGFIFQFHFLLPEFNVIENVLINVLIKKGKIEDKDKKRAIELLEYVGLKEKLNINIDKISGGEQQRVAIARSLINNPEIILADEPTGNLDSKTSEEIYKLLRKINKEYNTTFIIVTHSERISKRCDKIIKIIDGKI
ncbi:lipoprotein-releasing system ATP-binding protein [Cetobacterium ceti]|uniref:Lipoprotein-releasing system ATP-binding protein n=1 Tax=Cetobacterium ceti TaxID=180163 RepID=A0A1T4NF04_9FUSO|nr:ABC transporter ATP-binding protein [Cetobacterium ceti]SJZ77656.1 lipoprotein-releasing system ATP-binding protein [Cetobacterium ceti]